MSSFCAWRRLLEPGGARVLSIPAGVDVRQLREVIRAVEVVGAPDARATDAGTPR